MADDFIDVDFTKEPQYVFGDLGAACFSSYEPCGDPPLTDREIDAWIEKTDAEGGGLDSLVLWILNQLNEGSCVGNAITQAVMVKLNKQFGPENTTQLSAISLYKQIGRSPSSGAVVSDGMYALQNTGILPLDTPANRAKFGDHVMPATGFYKPFPSGWKTTAAKFRGFEFKVIRSVAEIYTQTIKGNPVIVGRQGHSIVYLRPTRRQGRRVMKYANSWGNWGDGGFGYDTESQIRMSASWAFAVQGVVVS